MGKYYCPPETKQRVLAVLYINDGQITDERGHAISRMHRLMVSPPKLSSFRTNILALEVEGLVLRDNRQGTRHTNAPSRMTNVGAGCYGLYLAEDIKPEQWAIDELKEQINARMIGKAKKAEKTVKQAETKVKVTEIKADSNDPASQVAEALLAKVLSVINQPPTVVKDDSRVAVLENQLASLERNNKVLMEQVAKQEAEIKMLRNGKGHTANLTQNLKDSLTPEQWDKLVREAPKP